MCKRCRSSISCSCAKEVGNPLPCSIWQSGKQSAQPTGILAMVSLKLFASAWDEVVAWRSGLLFITRLFCVQTSLMPSVQPFWMNISKEWWMVWQLKSSGPTTLRVHCRKVSFYLRFLVVLFGCLFIELSKKDVLNLDLDEKIKFYDQANKQVAVLCNHQKTVNKNFD